MGSAELGMRGFSTKVSPLTQALLEADTRDIGDGLRAQGNYTPSPRKIPVSVYFDPAFEALEKERLWSKVWQFACREEDIPNIGDRVPYTVGNSSFIILRSGPSEFKAFHNACLHRGTQLCDGRGSGKNLRCPFHAWEWNLDGSLCRITSDWDFPYIKPEDYRLPEAKVGTWGGFIFINPDPAAAPLEQALGVLPGHFIGCPAEDRFTVFHIRKKVRANWKVTMEAFLEAYHVVETHADSLPFTGDASTQYDTWDDGASHISRLITPLGIPSPHLGDSASTADAANRAFEVFALGMPGVPVPKFDPASPLSARAQVAEWRRQLMGAGLGRDFSNWADTVFLDATQYLMFPNFCPWYGEGLPLVYQFLPYGDDPNLSIMNVRLTAPLPGAGALRPPSAEILELGFDDPFSSLPQIGLLSYVFDQDMSNLPRVQAGMQSMAQDRAYISLGRYQEQRILHFHEVLAKTLDTGTP